MTKFILKVISLHILNVVFWVGSFMFVIWNTDFLEWAPKTRFWLILYLTLVGVVITVGCVEDRTKKEKGT